MRRTGRSTDRHAARALLTAAAIAVVACGGRAETPGAPVERRAASLSPQAVSDCLEQQRTRFSELPLSDTGTVYAIDFGDSSVQIYVEPDGAAVEAQKQEIRAAEDEVGNTGSSRVILRSSGNVLLSWSSEPTAEQRAPVAGCVGFS